MMSISLHPVAEDVLEELRKIQESDAIVFIYPNFWTEAPAKLIGWFDRVWSSGFAYDPNPQMKQLKKALFIISAGKNQKHLKKLVKLMQCEPLCSEIELELELLLKIWLILMAQLIGMTNFVKPE